METTDYIGPISKSQLAMLMNVSNSTVRTYLNKIWYEELKNLGYDKDEKILSPRQIEYIESQWGKFDLNLVSERTIAGANSKY